MAKLLVCDDESGLRAVILRYAQHEGHEVREAADGQEAVEACRAESSDPGLLPAPAIPARTGRPARA